MALNNGTTLGHDGAAGAIGDPQGGSDQLAGSSEGNQARDGRKILANDESTSGRRRAKAPADARPMIPIASPDNAEFESALQKAKRGNSDGFDWLYKAYNRRVGALVRSEACPDPDEVVNTVFFKAFRSIDRFTGNQANFASYLYQIARFQVIDERRARNRRVEIGDDLSLDLADGDAGPEELAERSDNASRTFEALQVLTTEQREVLVLRVFFGLTGPETAEALDKPVGAVRSLQNRAEARLRGLVESGAVVL